jgi:hypothetical protein
MRYAHNARVVFPILGCVAALVTTAAAFEGRINAVMTRGNETNALLYTVGTTSLRVELTATNSDPSRAGWPNPVDILDRNTGALTLLFPNNRSFLHVKAATDAAATATPGPLGMPMPPGGLPPGLRRDEVATATQAGIGPQTPAGPGAAGMPAMPAMPMPMMPDMMEKMELKATGQTTNLLGFACQRYELKQRGETLEIWATDQLPPYQPYVQNQPHRFGPRRIEEQWPELVKARKLFPLLAVLRSDRGPERFRFEVQSVTPQQLTDDDAKLFQPPAGWMEIQPLPF